MRAIGIDIGITTISAVVVNMERKNVEIAYTISNDSFLSTEYVWEKIQDPSAIIYKAIKLLEEILERYQDIAVIGLTGQMHGIVYVDECGKHCSPLYTWQDGREDIPYTENIMKQNYNFLKKKSICQMLNDQYGLKTYTGYGLVTHLYQKQAGTIPENARTFCTIGDYLGMRMTGRRIPLLHSSNAASLGFYDVRKRQFQKELLKELGVTVEFLPETVDEFILLGEWKKIPVAVALGDNQASFLGSVKDASNSLLVNMGTGGQISVLSDTYFQTKNVEAYPFTKNGYLLVGGSLCGGKAYAILENFFRQYGEALGVRNMDYYEVMERILQETPRNQEKLQVYTTFSGIRSNPELRGSILNIGEKNFTPAALILGVLEGMTQEIYGIYQEIAGGLQISRTQLIASGNGLRKNWHLQKIMQEIFSMQLKLAPHREEAAYGAGTAGWIAAGGASLKDIIGVN